MAAATLAEEPVLAVPSASDKQTSSAGRARGRCGAGRQHVDTVEHQDPERCLGAEARRPGQGSEALC